MLTAQSLRFYKQSTKPQIVRPADLVASVLDVYSTKLINNGVELQKRDRTSESIVCLESEIRQVISNLVRNALDAMAATGGRLLVRTREATEWRTAVRGVAITIADTGVGMDAATLSQIYTAFYTTKGIAGTGLGLWVSSEIVARHHGRCSSEAARAQTSTEPSSPCSSPTRQSPPSLLVVIPAGNLLLPWLCLRLVASPTPATTP